MPKTFLQFIAAGCMLIVTASSCNNSDEKKEPAKDSTTVTAPATPAVSAPVDTTHKDTGSTRPVKTPD